MTKMGRSSPQSIPGLPDGPGGFLPHPELKVLGCSAPPGQGRALSEAIQKVSRPEARPPTPSETQKGPHWSSSLSFCSVFIASPQRVMLEKNWPSEFL